MGWTVRLGTVVVMGLVGLGLAWWTSWPGPRWLERVPEPESRFASWTDLAPGVSYTRSSRVIPRPLQCHVIRIDLTRPELEIVVSGRPASPDGFRAAWASSLLHEGGLLAAINATPFQPEPYLPGPVVGAQGLVVFEGLTGSDPARNLDALVRSRSGVWSIQRGQVLDTNLSVAVGGFLCNLKAGENIGEIRPRDAVTAVGLTADRHWMYWLVVDGGQPGYSEGVSPQDSAELLRSLGASDGLHLDGGASTVMTVAGGWTGARVMNRPRSPLFTGFQRPVACVLGVRLKGTSRP